MAYLGNLNGPRESDIVNRLGHTFFGIMPAQLAADIDMYEDSERRQEIRPVHVDKDGRPYFVVSKPNKKQEFLYLEDYGWTLEGEIETYTDEEAEYWRERFESK